MKKHFNSFVPVIPESSIVSPHKIIRLRIFVLLATVVFMLFTVDCPAQRLGNPLGRVLPPLPRPLRPLGPQGQPILPVPPAPVPVPPAPVPVPPAPVPVPPAPVPVPPIPVPVPPVPVPVPVQDPVQVQDPAQIQSEQSVKSEKETETRKEETPAIDELPDVPEMTEEEQNSSPNVNSNLLPAEPSPAKESEKQENGELQEEAINQVLEKTENSSEVAPVLKHASKEDIQKSVEEATKEVELDNQNQHIDGIVVDSHKEVDEEAIEDAVSEVLNSSTEIEKKETNENTTESEPEEVLPESVDKILKDLDEEAETTEEATLEVMEENSESTEESTLEESEEVTEEAAEEKPALEVMEENPESTEESTLEESEEVTEEAAEEKPALEVMEENPESTEESTLEESEEVTEEAAEKAAGEPVAEEMKDEVEKAEEPVEAAEVQSLNTEPVKLEDLDAALTLPEKANYEELLAFLTRAEKIRPAELNQNDPEELEKQVKTYFNKKFEAQLKAAEQMLVLEGLTDAQWEEAVSWKVQSLANLFRLDEKYVGEMRDFLEEIKTRASKEVLWKVESILIEMELVTVKEQPEPEELKEHVNRMLEHTKKGIENNCVSLDFVLAAVQMVVLTEDILTAEESKEIFEKAIEILNVSEIKKLQETAGLLQKILNQREIIGQKPELELTTHDGKTVKTEDFAGKTLLLYCFSLNSKDQLHDLGFMYQLYMGYHPRGLEIIGILPHEKTKEMEEITSQIPWPMVFEAESTIEKLTIPVLPAKVLVNKEGKIINVNMDSIRLMKYLDSEYGSLNAEAQKAEKEEAVEKVGKKLESEEVETLDEPADVEETRALEKPEDLLEDGTEDVLKKNDEVKEESKETPEEPRNEKSSEDSSSLNLEDLDLGLNVSAKEKE